MKRNEKLDLEEPRPQIQQGPAHREETQRRLSTPRGKKEKDRDTSKQKHTAQKLIAEAGTQWVW